MSDCCADRVPFVVGCFLENARAFDDIMPPPAVDAALIIAAVRRIAMHAPDPAATLERVIVRMRETLPDVVLAVRPAQGSA